jgi:hypothetical protein
MLREGELEERERLAWSCYAGRVRDLEGEHYVRAERDAWAELQSALRGIAADRGAIGDEEALPRAA